MKNSAQTLPANSSSNSSGASREICEVILIQARPEKVWQVLTDLDRYSEWNPFIIESAGEVAEGKKIRNVMMMNGRKLTFKPRLLEVRSTQSLIWLGHTFLPGIMDGRHWFRLEAMANGGTRLIQGENFSGLLAGWMMRNYGAATSESFRRMNEALKARAESLS